MRGKFPFFSADLMFGYDYCPLVRQLRGRRNDKMIGLGVSLGAHLCLLIISGIAFIKPVEFGVDQGLSGMEIQLIAGSDEAVAAVAEVVKETPPEKPDFVQPEEIKEPLPEPEPAKAENLGNSDINAFSTGQGAITEAKPDYLKNPAPRYPMEARRKGWEGTVVLKALVDQDGHPVSIDVEKSSGYSVLDEAAVKTVKTWQFRPAQIGSMKIESSVQVPVRFKLEDLNGI